MKPARTLIRLANPGGEWNRLYALARKAGIRVHKGDFAFPTVVAERDGKVVGFVSTWPTEEAIVAGPLVIEDAPNPFLFLRLAEGYENLLRHAGVKVYLHTIDKTRPEHVGFMEKLGFVRLRENEEYIVMQRKL
jgi:hypothetical protein